MIVVYNLETGEIEREMRNVDLERQKFRDGYGYITVSEDTDTAGKKVDTQTQELVEKETT